jgi:hypothetical protein
MRWFRRPSGPPAARESSDDVRFFFYFDDEEAARSAVLTLESQGFGVTLTAPLTELAQWMVIAWGIPDTADLDMADDRFAEWASNVRGEFGGHATKSG